MSQNIEGNSLIGAQDSGKGEHAPLTERVKFARVVRFGRIGLNDSKR